MPNIGNITGKRAALRYHGRWHDVTLDEHGYLTAYIPERDTNVQPERPAPPPCQGCGTSVKNGQDNLFGACRRNAMGWAPTVIPGCTAKTPCQEAYECRHFLCPNFRNRRNRN